MPQYNAAQFRLLFRRLNWRGCRLDVFYVRDVKIALCCVTSELMILNLGTLPLISMESLIKKTQTFLLSS